MSDALKLDEKILKHFNYHWLWGLRYSKDPQAVNFNESVNTLVQNKMKLTQLMEHQHSLYQRSAFLRFFYWLFNINNYSYHAYLLVACIAHQNYLHSLGGSSSMKLEGTIPLTFAILAAGLFARRRIAYFTDLTASKLATEDVSSTALIQHSLVTEPIPVPAYTNNKAIIVTNPMLPYLKILGITLNIGDSLKLSEFKSICKQRFLETHPDKPGGTAEAFHHIKEAAERLTELISSASNFNTEAYSCEDNFDEFWANFNTRLDKLFADIDNVNKKATEAHKKATKAYEKATEADKKATDANRSIEILKQQMQELALKAAKINAPTNVNLAASQDTLFAKDTEKKSGSGTQPGVTANNTPGS